MWASKSRIKSNYARSLGSALCTYSTELHKGQQETISSQFSYYYYVVTQKEVNKLLSIP